MSTGNTPLNSAPGWESETCARNGTIASIKITVIEITVQGYLTFKAPLGKRQVTLPEGSSLGDLLASLRREIGGRFAEEVYNQAGELHQHVAIMLNGVHYRHLPDGLNAILKEADQVAIFPPLAGG